MEFVLILAPNPRDLLSKWSQVTGQAPLPPYFSLGYHQSRWSYFSADDVSNVNFRFDFYDLPYDVIWLDIDVSLFEIAIIIQATNEFEYFTWNPVRFPNVSLDIMSQRLDASQRKVVVISDPHIRKNESYFLYQSFMELEAGDGKTGKQRYLVKDPYKLSREDDFFVGNCWPG